MANCVSKGIAFHNGDLGREDREVIEDLFRKGVLRLVCTTTTLAQGVNLPAHLVIVKSTKLYYGGQLREYDSNTVMQMVGRAGRPQYGNTGVAVVMTASSSAEHYRSLLSGPCDTIESQLLQRMAEHITAEACRKTVNDIPGVVRWVKSTFLWTRVKRSPERYGLAPRDASVKEVESRLTALCVSTVNELVGAELLRFDGPDNAFRPEELASLMTKYYISFHTMKEIVADLSNLYSEELILKAVSGSKEFTDEFILRRSEKKTLNEVNKLVRYPIPGRVTQISEKALLLMQGTLADQFDTLSDDPGLRSDSVRIMPIASRISRCLAEILMTHQKRSSLTRIVCALRVSRSIDNRAWWNGDCILKQIPGVGPNTCLSLAKNGIRDFDVLQACSPRKLEAILSKNPPYGNEIQSKVRSFPKLSIDNIDASAESGRVRVRAEFSMSLRRPTEAERIWKKSMKSSQNLVLIIEAASAVEKPICFKSSLSLSSEAISFRKEASFHFREARKTFTVRVFVGSDSVVGIDQLRAIPYRFENGKLRSLSDDRRLASTLDSNGPGKFSIPACLTEISGDNQNMAMTESTIGRPRNQKTLRNVDSNRPTTARKTKRNQDPPEAIWDLSKRHTSFPGVQSCLSSFRLTEKRVSHSCWFVDSA
eukprot:Plantae.Rhodophyta-Rhodochaete_pulchella.ctg946.p1 GENE.Plantae.Rhodophyta-Rhodochaete_pulchella.ctg946~~Plantae.Rhodophyta-Rhodochaete_pulchella.ctg946.p1  ORF type:complete len:651 (-),score=85.85 Plantae.Rhodophyta-Rhodochaete_pulchella.ctg946:636-2588(-)